MTAHRDPTLPLTPEDWLQLAMDASDPREAADFARRGLALGRPPAEPEAVVLLWREVLKSHLIRGQKRSALAVGRKMVAAGALPELAHADLARSFAALGRFEDAARAYRIAARHAAARRRALHWASCASAFHHAGRHDEALAALERAIRWSTRSRPLHMAQRALVLLDAGRPAPDLEAVEADLEASPMAAGIGQWVLGLLALHRGDRERAETLLAAFVQRVAHDPLKAATLRGELARAARVLAGTPARQPATVG